MCHQHFWLWCLVTGVGLCSVVAVALILHPAALGGWGFLHAYLSYPYRSSGAAMNDDTSQVGAIPT